MKRFSVLKDGHFLPDRIEADTATEALAKAAGEMGYGITSALDPEEGASRCDNCHGLWLDSELEEPKRLTERLDPGGVVPRGECPECGALSYPVKAWEIDPAHWTALEEFGAFFRVEGKELLVAAMCLDDGIDRDNDGAINYGEAVLAEPEGFIERINEVFGTSYTERDFPGR